LIKAGLLPQLSPDVCVVYLDATATDTESRLLQRIKNVCPDASPTAGLAELMAWIRRGRGIPGASKLVVVIDQFEQWLQAHETDRIGELLDALRQCDGTRVQCLLMVRVDFMMSIHRFMNEIETPIQEGANSAPVDLFDALHAAKVLRLFGASYGRLPEDPQPVDADGQAFIDAAIAELGPEGKVVPVHLALFADMCKGRPWRLDTLKQLGGARGVGVTFLEETFESTTAPLAHRVHEKACRAILKSLLPPIGAHIRGQAQSRKQLAEAAGVASDSKEFQAALEILDRDTRLITPVEREEGGQPAAAEADASSAEGEGRYQLTHDYLVPSLREWLTKKQRETARGRAELRLEEYSHSWNDKPAASRLPGFLDWASIRALTPSSKWTPPQRKMMKAAGRRVGMRSALTTAAVLCLIATGIAVNRKLKSQGVSGLVNQLATADIASVPDIIAKLGPVRDAAAPLLVDGYAHDGSSPQYRLNTALAALSLEQGGAETASMVDEVYSSMLQAEPDDLATMLGCVGPQAAQIGDRASAAFEAAEKHTDSILQTASLVAATKPDTTWKPNATTVVADHLVTAPTDVIGGWARQLRPARQQLMEPLEQVFLNVERPTPERNVAGDLLVVFAPDEDQARAKSLVDVLEHSTSLEQFGRTMKQLEPLATAAQPLLATRLGELDKLAPDLFGADREALGLRQMYLVAAQLRLGAADVPWQAFRHSSEPTLRSLLIENLHALGVGPAAVIERLKSETDAGVRRALVLSLGGYEKGQLESLDLAEFTQTLQRWSADENAGLHSAAAWLLNQWVAKKLVAPAANPPSREESAALAATGDAPTWYTNGQGHEMVVLRGPIDFAMGAPATDPDREGGALDLTELRHPVHIGRSFALATKEVTLEQFQKAWADLRNRPEFFGADRKAIEEFPYAADKAPEKNCPAINVSWFKAAAYCNWLSQQEGIPSDEWCYRDNEAFQSGLVPAPNFLSLRGYRLPTEAEWEYACRSGTTSGRFFGEAPHLLNTYAWYDGNNEARTWPVGLLKPNEFGFFDIYGNVSEWCQDEPRKYTDAKYDDVEPTGRNLLVDAEKVRAHRGGAFQYVPQMVTSAARDRSDPDYDYFSLGFRVARTLTPGEQAAANQSVDGARPGGEGIASSAATVAVTAP
jgi:formylglycine-generating enzyme required for sulfatase activity